MSVSSGKVHCCATALSEGLLQRGYRLIETLDPYPHENSRYRALYEVLGVTLDVDAIGIKVANDPLFFTTEIEQSLSEEHKQQPSTFKETWAAIGNLNFRRAAFTPLNIENFEQMWVRAIDFGNNVTLFLLCGDRPDDNSKTASTMAGKSVIGREDRFCDNCFRILREYLEAFEDEHRSPPAKPTIHTNDFESAINFNLTLPKRPVLPSNVPSIAELIHYYSWHFLAKIAALAEFISDRDVRRELEGIWPLLCGIADASNGGGHAFAFSIVLDYEQLLNDDTLSFGYTLTPAQKRQIEGRIDPERCLIVAAALEGVGYGRDAPSRPRGLVSYVNERGGPLWSTNLSSRFIYGRYAKSMQTIARDENRVVHSPTTIATDKSADDCSNFLIEFPIYTNDGAKAKSSKAKSAAFLVLNRRPTSGLMLLLAYAARSVGQLATETVFRTLSEPIRAQVLVKKIRFKDADSDRIDVASKWAAQIGTELHFVPHSEEFVNELIDVASTDVPVVILGPPGVGKELAARFIHTLWLMIRHNLEPGDPTCPTMYAVNCATLTTLTESELFGHSKGAFTGADRPHTGYLMRAAGYTDLTHNRPNKVSTCLLDEIADTPPDTQPKLLRALQELVVTPVGSCEYYDIGGIKLLAATNQIDKFFHSEGFREDLQKRLLHAYVKIPPLAEWGFSDNPELFCRVFNECAYRVLKKYKAALPEASQTDYGKLDPRFLQEIPGFEKLLAYDWTGNFRDVEAYICRLAHSLLRSTSTSLFPDPKEVFAARLRPDTRESSGKGSQVNRRKLKPLQGIPERLTFIEEILADFSSSGRFGKVGKKHFNLLLKKKWNEREFAGPCPLDDEFLYRADVEIELSEGQDWPRINKLLKLWRNRSSQSAQTAIDRTAERAIESIVCDATGKPYNKKRGDVEPGARTWWAAIPEDALLAEIKELRDLFAKSAVRLDEFKVDANELRRICDSGTKGEFRNFVLDAYRSGASSD